MTETEYTGIFRGPIHQLKVLTFDLASYTSHL